MRRFSFVFSLSFLSQPNGNSLQAGLELPFGFLRLCASAMDKARHSVYNMGRQFLKEKYYALD